MIVSWNCDISLFVSHLHSTLGLIDLYLYDCAWHRSSMELSCHLQPGQSHVILSHVRMVTHCSRWLDSSNLVKSRISNIFIKASDPTQGIKWYQTDAGPRLASIDPIPYVYGRILCVFQLHIRRAEQLSWCSAAIEGSRGHPESGGWWHVHYRRRAWPRRPRLPLWLHLLPLRCPRRLWRRHHALQGPRRYGAIVCLLYLLPDIQFASVTFIWQRTSLVILVDLYYTSVRYNNFHVQSLQKKKVQDM